VRIFRATRAGGNGCKEQARGRRDVNFEPGGPRMGGVGFGVRVTGEGRGPRAEVVQPRISNTTTSAGTAISTRGGTATGAPQPAGGMRAWQLGAARRRNANPAAGP